MRIMQADMAHSPVLPVYRPVLLSVWGSDVYDFPNESKIKKESLKKNILAATKIASTSECMARELKKVRRKAVGDRNNAFWSGS